jgi:hypothetical protein
MAPPVELKGRVQAEGVGFASQLRVRLTSPNTPGNPIMATTAADGHFTLEHVPPGTWDIAVEPIPEGGYIKSMRLGKQDVLTEDMEISGATDAPLNIVVSSHGGVVEGEIDDPAIAGHKAVMVLLAPTGRVRHVMSFFGFVQSQPDGKFKLRGLTPGTYKLLAFAELPPGDPRNPDLIARLEGKAIEVREGETVRTKIGVITSAQLKEALK